MSAAESNIVHTEIMQLRATPAQVREFILTPERILDYFPSPVDGGVLEPGNSIYCRGEMGTSMLELVAEESSDELMVIKVTTALGLEAPFTRARIEASSTFTMVEDWALAATRQIRQYAHRLTPARPSLSHLCPIATEASAPGSNRLQT